MEGSSSNRKGKRIRNDDDEDDYNPTLASIQERIPSFSSVILEALKKDEPNACLFVELIKRKIAYERPHHGNLEPFLRKTFNDLLPIFLHKLGTNNWGTLAGGSVVVPPLASSPPRILGSGGRKLQLCFETKMPTSLFSGDNVKGEEGSEIRVVLKDLSNGNVVQTGAVAAAKLNVVVLEGHFKEEISDGWTHEVFKGYQVKEREGKRPILVGNVQVTLKGGVGTLGDLSFTDNSRWTRSGMFRLGVELASGFYKGIRVMEGKANEVRVKDPRGKAYKKHCTPALHDEVWRLNGIAKDGPPSKRLLNAKISTVEDFLGLHAKDPQTLRIILGKRRTEKMWETTIKHAKTFGTKSSGIILDHIHEPIKLITNREVVPLESLDQTQKISHLAYENWHQVVECDAQYLSPFITSKEMQDCPAEQALDHNITPTQTGHTIQSVQQIQPDYASVLQQLLEPPFSSSDQEKLSLQNDWTGSEDLNGESISSWVDEMLRNDNDEFNIDFGIGHSIVLGAPFSDPGEAYYLGDVEAEPCFNGLLGAEPVHSVAVVGWPNIKAVFKWGIMARISAAEKRTKLTELD